MSQNFDSRTASVKGWDTYWHGAHGTVAYADGGATHPGIRAFWTEQFVSARGMVGCRSLLDIASGNGAVVDTALQVFASKQPEVTCVDASVNAIEQIEERFAGARGIVCDAGSIPLESGQFDIVTSQFGIEYAGIEAFGEAARLLAPGGRLACLVHHRSGVIQRECEENRSVILRMIDSQFLPLAAAMFRHGFRAVRGAIREPYDAAALELAAAMGIVEELIKQGKNTQAGKTVARLYSDVARIHEGMPDYDPDEVLAWLSQSEQELTAYAARMLSMIESALDERAFEQACQRLTDDGCMLENSGPFQVPDYPEPLAWAIVASKPEDRG